LGPRKIGVILADAFLELIRRAIGDGQLKLDSGKYCLNLASPGKLDNHITVYPRKTYLEVAFKTAASDEISAKLEAQGFGTAYDRRSGAYWLHLTKEDFGARQETLISLIRRTVNMML